MTTSIGPQTAPYNIDTNVDDFFVLLAGDTILSNSAGIASNSADSPYQLLINGTVIAEADAVQVDTAEVKVTIGPSAFVFGASDGFEAEAISSEVDVVNYGTVIGQGDAGIQIYGDDSSIINYGTATGQYTGIWIEGEDSFGVNHGTVNGAHGVRFNSEGTFINSGAITGTGAENFGYNDAIGVRIDGSTGEVFEVRNSGTIIGADFSVQGDFSNDSVVNSGDLTGVVDLGSGDDVMRFVGDGTLDGEILMGSGDDTVYGSRFEDEISGGADNDVIRGRGGDDLIYGDSGEDTLRGNDGDDEIYGGADNDRIYGGGGADDIFGDGGQDFMFGGAGADVFIIDDITDSGLTNTTRDSIRDFETGVDQLDLSELVFREMDFLGTSGFSGDGGDGEVRVKVVNGSTFVQIDLDADGTQDLQVYLYNVDDATAADFIL